ncbi:MAG: 2,3-bisphosphoglycerate-independent phosphoglycerate mutase [Phycisphaerales bacterium]
MPRNTPLVLIVRDGWGQNPHPEHDAFNAVKLAGTPVDDRLRRDWPFTLVKTAGLDVGVPPDQTGNSEVGHQNLGAGRIVDQEVVRISKACESGEIARVDAIRDALARVREAGAGSDRRLHLMGIASEAGVHGRLSHLYALMRAAAAAGLGRDQVCIHLFTDGRDTGPFTGKGFVNEVEAKCGEIGVGRVVSLAGRYWAMDRDFRWERVARAYACLTGRRTESHDIALAASAAEAMQRHYDHPARSAKGDPLAGDEFVPPTIIARDDADARATRIKDSDSVIFYNYRGDRPREISMAFVFPDDQWARVKPSPDSGKAGFDRGSKLDLFFVAMTAWAESLVPFMRVAFDKPPKMKHIAGEVFSSLGLRQFRCAETEKFPHVTFFFNDYRDEPFPGESRNNPQSPKVATYDLKPEMAAYEVRDAVLARLAAGDDCEDFILVNFANCDMVGHTGSLEAAKRAVEVTDACVGAIIDATLARNGSLIVTADHGNAEQMWSPEDNSPHTAHTLYDVPLYVLGSAFKGRSLRDGGRLADVLPTALAMMGIEQPREMTGRSLLA